MIPYGLRRGGWGEAIIVLYYALFTEISGRRNASLVDLQL